MMPELPEVETIRRVLAKKIVGRRIVKAEVRLPNPAASRLSQNLRQQTRRLSRNLRGASIKRISRRAKYLIVRLGEALLIFHLGMTGQIFVIRKKEHTHTGMPELPDKHTYFILHLSGDSRLYFRDIRKFGRIHLIMKKEEKTFFRALGPEPLSAAFTPESLRSGFKRKKASLKSLLLGQKIVSGLGNIYTDEVLFQVGILPQTPGGCVSGKKIAKLHKAIPRILKEAIRNRGTTFSDYYDPESRRGGFQARLRVYGRQDEPCLKCGTRILKAVIAQRGTHWCPRCQK
jgi:formamidopyrimidine-DNA glycosylase